MKRMILWIFILYLSSLAVAQQKAPTVDENIRHYLKQLESAAEEDKAVVLNELAYSYFHKSPDMCVTYAWKSIEQARKLVDKLAADAKLSPVFEVLGESDRERARELVTGSGVVLIAPSFFIRRPIYADLEKLDCRIELVEVSDKDD